MKEKVTTLAKGNKNETPQAGGSSIVSNSEKLWLRDLLRSGLSMCKQLCKRLVYSCACVYTPLIISHPDKLEQRSSQSCSCWGESCAKKTTFCQSVHLATLILCMFLLGLCAQPCSELDLGKEELLYVPRFSCHGNYRTSVVGQARSPAACEDKSIT